MRKVWMMALMLCIAISSVAQKPQTKGAQRRQTTTQKAGNTKKNNTTQKKQKTQKPQKSQKEQLQSRQKQLKKDIAANKRQKTELERKVKRQLEEAFILGTEIDEQKRAIDTLRTGLDSIDRHIASLDRQLRTLKAELAERQRRYASSVRYTQRNRKMQSRMMFILSAKTVNQMYRRTRFMNEYSTYQRAQGEAVRQKQSQVNSKREEMEQTKREQTAMLERHEQAQQTLQRQQGQKQQMAGELRKQQRTVAELIDRQQKEEAEINAQIERIVAEEIAREQARLEQERKRREEQQRREEESNTSRQARNTQKTQRSTAEKNGATGQTGTSAADDKDTRLSGSFAGNKGRLPMPITGAYQMVCGFGDNVVDGAKGVRLTSKGIYLKGQPGAQARCVFDGEVSKIFSTGKSYIVMVRHGRYISVYSDLASVSVTAGQKVSTCQTLGRLGPTHIMQFQLRNWTELLNPRLWLRR